MESGKRHVLEKIPSLLLSHPAVAIKARRWSEKDEGNGETAGQNYRVVVVVIGALLLSRDSRDSAMLDNFAEIISQNNEEIIIGALCGACARRGLRNLHKPPRGLLTVCVAAVSPGHSAVSMKNGERERERRGGGEKKKKEEPRFNARAALIERPLKLPSRLFQGFSTVTPVELQTFRADVK